jgi:hypothetical protein
MSRELRRCPPDWDHPRYTPDTARHPRMVGEYIPLYNQDFETKFAAWLDEALAWRAGTHPEYEADDPSWYNFVENCSAPPEPEYYRSRHWTAGEATAYQIYETVSEGTPVSPVFPTQDALRAWLLDTWRLTPEGADLFIRVGWVPSGMAYTSATRTTGFVEAERIPDLLAHTPPD